MPTRRIPAGVKAPPALIPGLNLKATTVKRSVPKVRPAKGPAKRPVNRPVKLAGVSGTASAKVGAQATKKVAAKKKGGTLATIDTVLSGKATAGIVNTAANAAGKAAGAAVIAVPLGQVASAAFGGKGVKKIARNAAHDLVDIPANAIPSIYEVGKTAVEGHPGAAAKQLAQPYVDFVKHPGKSLMDHPIGSALLAAGGEGAVSRGVGKALRVAPSKALRDLGSTKRAPAVVPGTRLAKERAYSKDPLVKAVQKVTERKGPVVMKPHEIKRRVDENFAASEDIRRLHRGQATQAAEQALGKKPTAAVTLDVQNVANSKPELVAYHSQLVDESKNLEGVRLRANRTARKQVQKAIKSYEPAEVKRASVAIVKRNLPAQAKLAKAGLLDAGRQEKARLIPYAVQKMGAEHVGEELVDAAGKPLSTAAIRAHMAEHGVSEPGYVTNAPNQRGARNFYVATHEPPRLTSETRTGLAIKQGTADLHPDVLVEGEARTQGLADAADSYGRFIREFGQHDAETGQVAQFKTYAAAEQAAKEHPVNRAGDTIKGALPMRPVSLNPFGGTKAQLEALMETANDDSHPALAALHDAQHRALEGHGAGPWALVPDAAARRAQQHIRTLAPGTVGRIGNLYGSRFRTAVLATSPKWLTGNVAEATLRSAVAHAGPRSYLTAKRALAKLDKLDPTEAELARSRMIGGGNFALSRRTQVHSSAEQFSDSRLRPAAEAVAKFWRSPGPKQVAGVWHAYTNIVFNKLNGRLESQFQTAMLGKALRDHPLMSARVMKLSTRAVDEAARGLRNTNTQVALGREVDRMYGAYGKYSPELKRAIQTFTPFIPWSINAVHFLYWALPKDHPVLTSLIASANQASEEWRKAHGLELGAAGAVPGFLMGSIPVGSGKLRASRYTPAGLFGNDGAFGGAGATFVDSIFPQFSSTLAALKGKDWKGSPLKGVSPEMATVQALLGGFVPLAGQVSRISTNPGPLTDKLRKELDPTWATTGKPATAKALKVVRGPAKASSVWDQQGGSSTWDQAQGGSSVWDK